MYTETGIDFQTDLVHFLKCKCLLSIWAYGGGKTIFDGHYINEAVILTSRGDILLNLLLSQAGVNKKASEIHICIRGWPPPPPPRPSSRFLDTQILWTVKYCTHPLQCINT